MPNQTLSCRDCSQSFEFSERDQNFFAEKNFSAPSRCPKCRSARKGTSNQSARPERPMFSAYCKNGEHSLELPFEINDSRPFNCREHKSPPRIMYEAFCLGNGGHTTQVPFQTDPKRDFYCREHPQPKFSAYCVAGDHTVSGLNREPITGKDFFCREHPRPMFSAFCTGGGHTTQVPFEPKGDKDFYCRAHPKPLFSGWCVGGSHTKENLPFEPDSDRDFYCKEHPRPRGGGGSGYQGSRNDGLGLTFRSDNRDNHTGSTSRSGMPGLSFNKDRSGNTRGSSQRVPGLGLTFHHDNNGKTIGTSRHIPGIGTFTEGRNGKMKSFTDNRGFRSGPDGKSKGSSRRI